MKGLLIRKKRSRRSKRSKRSKRSTRKVQRGGNPIEDAYPDATVVSHLGEPNEIIDRYPVLTSVDTLNKIEEDLAV
jgi:hypothetical protein